MSETLWRSICRLQPLNPTSVAVTYGIGSATRARTHAVLARLLSETSLKPAAHLTCVASTRAEVDAIARSYWALGVRRAVALRGDPPGDGGGSFVPRLGGYVSTVELVKGLKAIAPFEITVAVHPEKHPHSQGLATDIDVLQAKIDAGADAAVTQFFFENESFLHLRERARARGISIPIVPGIMPVHNFQRLVAFCAKAGVSVPQWLCRRFEGVENDPDTHRLIAAATCAEQVLDLVDEGVREFHFYTLNRADLVYAICHMLGLRPHASSLDNN